MCGLTHRCPAVLKILRSIYLSERKRWEEGQARISRMWQASVEDQEMDTGMNGMSFFS